MLVMRMQELLLTPVEAVLYLHSRPVPPELPRITVITDGREDTYIELVNVPYASDDCYLYDASGIPDDAVISKIKVKAKVRNIIANRTTYIKSNVYSNDDTFETFYGTRKMVWKTTSTDFDWEWPVDPVDGVAWTKQRVAQRCFGVSLESHLSQTILYWELDVWAVFTVP